MKKYFFTEEQQEEIISAYLNNYLSMREIGNIFGVSKNVIKRILLENSIEIRTSNHHYKADYDKFHNINSAEKAYWLGFIAADGCVYKRKENASLVINLSSKDKQHLINFRTFMNSNVEIKDFVQEKRFSNNTQMSKIVLNSKELVEDLITTGTIPRKSLILKKPNIEEKFFMPYIKGYFDGDGSIYKTNQSNNFSISLLGTKEFLLWVEKVLEWDARLEQRIKDSSKNNYYIRCGGTNKPYLIMRKFYESVNIGLERKQELYSKLKATVVLNGNI